MMRGKRPHGGRRVHALRPGDVDLSVQPKAEPPVPPPGEPGGPGRVVDLSTPIAMTTEIIDLSRANLGQTRYITGQLLDGHDPVKLLHHRGISLDVAKAVAAMSGAGTVTRPNAILKGHPRNLAITIERDREALYRGAYLFNAAQRVQAAVDGGASLRDALNAESPYYRAHEAARKARLHAVTDAQRIAARFGIKQEQPDGQVRTLLGWYLNPLLKNDPECVAANGHNFYAEEGSIIGYPGGVHVNCGCCAGPAHIGMGMVNDAVQGVVALGHVGKKPTYTLSRKRKTA